jgi:ethanolaminephosphotransferase
LNILWLSYPSYNHSALIHSPLFLPFIAAWGLQHAHQVGLMILAHVTSQPFPIFDGMWIWTAALAVDQNMEWLFDRYVFFSSVWNEANIFSRPPVFQTTPERRAMAIYATLGITIVLYGRFVYRVINEITDYLGIACFTVRKKDKAGHWEDAKKVDAQRKDL